MHPVLKALLIGLTLQGAFQEVRMLTTGANGASALEQIGSNGSTMADLDRLMEQASMGMQDTQTGIGNGQPSVDLMQERIYRNWMGMDE